MVEKKQSRPKVSVVVPIYNVEKYLHECVDSILAQTLYDIEVILVDDGSPDMCGKIVDEYAKLDSRVIAIHQKNGGYSKAVNRGIDLASGEYIGIIESDDWIEPDMYDELYKSAHNNNTDITKGMFYYYNPAASKEIYQNVIYKNPCGVDLRFAPNRPFMVTDWPKIIAFHASIWSSIYRADFVKKIKIPETAGASYQDFPFMMETMCKAKRITVVKKPFVHWRNEPKQGNSTSARGKKLLLMGKNTETGLNIIKESGYYNKLKEAFYAQALWANIGFFYKIDKQYKQEYFNILHNIFLNIKDDPYFHYLYFRFEDKMAAKALIYRTYQEFEFSHIIGGIRRKLVKGLRKIFPTYRAVAFNRDQIQELKLQNSLMIEQLEEIKTELDK